jgi:hypothetical protein
MACVEIISVDKSRVTEMVSDPESLRMKHSVPMSNVLVDEDGVGGGVVDLLRGKAFVGNATQPSVTHSRYQGAFRRQGATTACESCSPKA